MEKVYTSVELIVIVFENPPLTVMLDDIVLLIARHPPPFPPVDEYAPLMAVPLPTPADHVVRICKAVG